MSQLSAARELAGSTPLRVSSVQYKTLAAYAIVGTNHRAECRRRAPKLHHYPALFLGIEPQPSILCRDGETK